MIAFLTDYQDEIWRISVTAEIFLQDFWIDLDGGVLFQRSARRQLVIGGKTFPRDGRERIHEQVFQQRFVDALTIPAIRHDENSRTCFVETDGVVSPAIIVPFFEKSLAVRSPIKSPGQAVTQADWFVFFCDFICERGKFVLGHNLK